VILPIDQLFYALVVFAFIHDDNFAAFGVATAFLLHQKHCRTVQIVDGLLGWVSLLDNSFEIRKKL
jgi:hypothetical protein